MSWRSRKMEPGATDPEARGVQEEHGLLEKSISRGEVTIQKLNRHLLPKFFILTVLCYIDRTNLAFAALTMNEDLQFTASEYGIASGVFFLSYAIFQVPSNVVLYSIPGGGRVWLSILIISWGVVATSFAALKAAPHAKAVFYFLRFLLGAAESGTMPGMWYHASTFYSDSELTVAWSWVLVGIALSQVAGGPIAAGLLALDGMLGLRGWQLLFLFEGLPTVLMGIYIACSLAESPAKASFLTPEEREWLIERNSSLSSEALGRGAVKHTWGAVRSWRTWHLAVMNLVANIPKFGIIFWCPLIIDALLGGTQKKAVVALLTSLPFGVAAAAIIANARHSKATGERRLHVAAPLAVAALALAAMSLLVHAHPAAALAFLLLAAVAWAPDSVLASWPATFLRGAGAASGVALINSIGSIGGLIGPVLIGAVQERGGGYTTSFMILAASCAFVAVLAVLFREVPPLKRRCSSRLSAEGPHPQLRCSEEEGMRLGVSSSPRR